MKTNGISTRFALRPLLSLCGLLFCSQASAQEISTMPLYAGGGAKANVLFMIDDSGSMQDAVSPTQAAGNTTELSGMEHSQFLIAPTSTSDAFDTLLTTLDDSDAGYSYLALCPGVNVLAFDPSKTYAPWYGLDDSSFPNAQKVPNQPGKGTTNLATARYLPWIDSNDNGKYDFRECGEIEATTTRVRRSTWYWPYYEYVNEKTVTFDTSRLQSVSTLTQAQKQNYANWYTYHRSREYAVKAGLSPTLAEARVRAGLSTIHIHNQAGIQWGLNMADVDDISDPALAANKAALIDEFYEVMEVNPTNFGGTPLRRTLENAGLYFHLGDPSQTRRPERYFLPDVSTSPILSEDEGGACQANHMILVTDGYQYEFSGQGPRFNWGNQDATAASGGGLYADDLSNTMADIAMYFYDRDASPSLPGKQNVHTHAVSFGVYGNIDGFPLTEADKAWPTDASRLVGTPSNGELVLPESLDDVVHAAFNGRGKFMTATDAQTLKHEMDDLMRYISVTRKGTATEVSFDKQGLAASTTMFRTLYEMENWAGKLNAYEFAAATGIVGSERWEASERLGLKDFSNQRKIVTYNGLKGAPFRAPADLGAPDTAIGELNTAQIADLLADKPAGVDSADYLQDMIEYQRSDGDGYTTDPQFRLRSRLGDIVHSSPVYVGAPEAYYPDNFESDAYSDFVADHGSRTAMVYVGANDGMLHGFNATNGDEVFAYIPQAVFSSEAGEGLHSLADPNYAHLPYVDETPVTGDVFIDNDWRTYLVGGLGRGGKAVFVLDVTDPAGESTEADVATDVVVTEFTDPHLGYTFGTPKIAKLEDGEWVAIFGNGYNNGTDGKAYLYVLYLDGSGPGGASHIKVGPLGGNTVGSVVGGACENATSDCNGLSAPTTVDLNSNGKLDLVYAGDLHGNVWAFDFTKDRSGDRVTVDNPSRVVPVVAHEDSSDNKVPLFTACRGSRLVSGFCARSNRQPITTKPTVAAHRYRGGASSEPNLMIYVGTGRYLSETDVTTTDRQSFYGVWDAGDGAIWPTDLTSQTIALDVNGNRTMTTANTVPYIQRSDSPSVAGNYGWRMDLPASGERVVQGSSIVNDILLFPTRITSNDICDRTGTGFIMGVHLTTGAAPGYQVFPDQQADIGIPEVSGGDINPPPPGTPTRIYTSDPDDDAPPPDFRIVTEPKRAPTRSSWMIVK